jgi:hypothetical protein
MTSDLATGVLLALACVAFGIAVADLLYKWGVMPW